MLGCYLTSADADFLDVITDELDNFQLSTDPSVILLFPSLSSRHRLLVHRLRQARHPALVSFSVGEEKQSRRTIVAFKAQLMEETVTTSAATAQIDGDASAKRRPAQALYKPPRRSQPAEAPSPPPPVVVDVPLSKVTKSKTTRPSAEPYVPPSRRNVEPTPPLTSDTAEEEEEEEEDWEKLADRNDESGHQEMVDEIQSRFKDSVQIKKPTHDYSQWTVEDIQIKEADLAHVLEVSNFPSTFSTEDLSTAFTSLTRTKFDIKWVDETHALIVFADVNTALDVLQMEHPLFKICPVSQASAASKKKSKSSAEFLQPYKSRPQTSSLTANRRICAALGLKNPMSTDKAKTERQKIETARQQKVRDKEEQKAVWDGGVLPSPSSS